MTVRRACGWMVAAAACAAALALSACASDGAPGPAPAAEARWTGGDPARLAADEAACRRDAASVDVNQISGYSDPRYGMTSAMAAAVAKDNPMSDTRPQIRAATFAACMGDKGWRQP
jgi:hypothetical protein